MDFNILKTPYQKAVYDATASTLADQDWTLSLDLCELINNEDDSNSPKNSKDLLNPLRKRFNDKRNQVKFMTLCVIDTIVKNCGQRAHKAIFDGDFIEELLSALKTVKDHAIRQKLLEMVSLWHASFKDIEYPTCYILATRLFNVASNEGYTLPETKPNEIILVKGITDGSRSRTNTYPSASNPRGVPNGPAGGDAARIAQQEEDELAMALRLSMEEQEKEKQRQATYNFPSVPTEPVAAEPAPVKETNAYPDLAALTLAPAVSVPAAGESTGAQPPIYEDLMNQPQSSDPATTTQEVTLELGKYDCEDSDLVRAVIHDQLPDLHIQDPGTDFLSDEDETFLRNFSKSIDILVLRMQSCSQRGRNLMQDSTAQQLLGTVMGQQDRLLQIMANVDGQRQHYENFNDKLQDIRDAREAIDTMRTEIRAQEELRRQEEERLRKAVMQQKLEKLRMDKDAWIQQRREEAMRRYQVPVQMSRGQLGYNAFPPQGQGHPGMAPNVQVVGQPAPGSQNPPPYQGYGQVPNGVPNGIPNGNPQNQSQDGAGQGQQAVPQGHQPAGYGGQGGDGQQAVGASGMKQMAHANPVMPNGGPPSGAPGQFQPGQVPNGHPQQFYAYGQPQYQPPSHGQPPTAHQFGQPFPNGQPPQQYWQDNRPPPCPTPNSYAPRPQTPQGYSEPAYQVQAPVPANAPPPASTFVTADDDDALIKFD